MQTFQADTNQWHYVGNNETEKYQESQLDNILADKDGHDKIGEDQTSGKPIERTNIFIPDGFPNYTGIR